MTCELHAQGLRRPNIQLQSRRRFAFRELRDGGVLITRVRTCRLHRQAPPACPSRVDRSYSIYYLLAATEAGST